MATLLSLAQERPDFRAEITLLARNHDRWEYHRFAISGEVMGPVIRPVGEVELRVEADLDPADHPMSPGQLARARCRRTGVGRSEQVAAHASQHAPDPGSGR